MSEDASAAQGRYDEALSVKGAATKANRERQRRIRLNDSFLELARVLDPGKTPKTDKASIVADAIRVVTQLRTENGQLQQLNKFLEERVASHEKARSDAMMRQAMYQGLNHPNYMPPQLLPGGVVLGQPVQGVPLQQPMGQPAVHGGVQPGQPLAQEQQTQHQACSSSRVEAKGENEIGTSSQPFPNPAPSAMGQLSELLNSDQGIFDWALGEASGSPHEHGWLHLDGVIPDTTQDSLKRPPAA